MYNPTIPHNNNAPNTGVEGRAVTTLRRFRGTTITVALAFHCYHRTLHTYIHIYRSEYSPTPQECIYNAHSAQYSNKLIKVCSSNGKNVTK